MSLGPIKNKLSWSVRNNRSFEYAIPWLILGAFAVSWFSFFATISPEPAGPDVFVFRDAGCNWAQGMGLVAASVPHATTVRPEIFASYTPGAVLLFGVVASLFGCSGTVNTFYNLAIAVAGVSLLYHCFTLAVASHRQRIYAAVLLGIIFPTGMVGFDPDRPEIPAFGLLLAILLMWRSASSLLGKILLLGSVGFVFLIHPFAGFAGWFLLVFLLFFGKNRIEFASRSTWLKVVVIGTGLYALVLIAWAASIWSQDHAAIYRFFQHAAGQGTGAGILLHGSQTRAHNGYGAAFGTLFNLDFPASAALATSLLVSCGVIAAWAYRMPERAALFPQYVFLLLILLIFPLFVFPAQTNYLGLSRALLLAVLFIGGFPLANALRTSIVPLFLIVIVFLCTVPWVGLATLKNAETADSYRRELAQARRVRLYFDQRGIRNAALVVDAGHYFVYKPYFTNLYNPNYLQPGATPDQFQGLILCYSGSLAFSRTQLSWVEALDKNKWHLVDGGEDVARVALFGHPLMRRNWSWMCDAYARN